MPHNHLDLQNFKKLLKVAENENILSRTYAHSLKDPISTGLSENMVLTIFMTALGNHTLPEIIVKGDF